ncbi:hypothetical protein ACN27G_09795 [Plantactinospora sp. WMMB334]|uniref:hypothetical protein n=1 Tax=Plantactinospora sp. WMMB334 TaxID=3404119 RepID=UPI003B927614
MLGVLRHRWTAALGTLAALTLVLAPVPAQADAMPAGPVAEVPTPAEIRADMARIVKNLPPPGPNGVQPRSVPLRLGKGTGPSTQYAFTCVARSNLKIVGVTNYNYVVAESTTGECNPPVLDFLATQTWLVQWLPDVGQWTEVMVGNYDGRPGAFVRSTTIQFACSMSPTNYAAFGYHYARGGTDSAIGYTLAPGSSACTLRP